MDDYTLNKLFTKKQHMKNSDKNTGKKIQEWFRHTFNPVSSASILQKLNRAHVNHRSSHSVDKAMESLKRFESSTLTRTNEKRSEMRRDKEERQRVQEYTRRKMNRKNPQQEEYETEQHQYGSKSTNVQKPMFIDFHSSRNSTEYDSGSISDMVYDQLLIERALVPNIGLVSENVQIGSPKKDAESKSGMKHEIWIKAFNRSQNIEKKSKYMLEQAQRRNATYRKSLRVFMTKMMHDFLASLIQTWWKTLLKNQMDPKSIKSLAFGHMIRTRVTFLLKDFLEKLAIIIIQKWQKRCIIQKQEIKYHKELQLLQKEETAHALWISAYKTTESIETFLLMMKKKVIAGDKKFKFKLLNYINEIKLNFIALTIQTWWKVSNESYQMNFIPGSYAESFVFGVLIKNRLRNLFKDAEETYSVVILHNWWSNIKEGRKMDMHDKIRHNAAKIIQTSWQQQNTHVESLASAPSEMMRDSTKVEESDLFHTVIADWTVKNHEKSQKESKRIKMENEIPKILLTEEEYPLESPITNVRSQSLEVVKLLKSVEEDTRNETMAANFELWKIAVILIEYLDELFRLLKQNSEFIYDGKLAWNCINALRKEVTIVMLQTRWKIKSTQTFMNSHIEDGMRRLFIQKLLNTIVSDMGRTVSVMIAQRSARRKLNAKCKFQKLQYDNSPKSNLYLAGDFTSTKWKTEDMTACKQVIVARSLSTVLMEAWCINSLLQNHFNSTMNVTNHCYQLRISLKSLSTLIRNKFLALNIQIWWNNKQLKSSSVGKLAKVQEAKMFFYESLIRRKINALLNDLEKNIAIKIIQIWFKSVKFTEEDRGKLIEVLSANKKIWTQMCNLILLHAEGIAMTAKYSRGRI